MRYSYTGQTMIPEAQVYYYKNRVYDPVVGRFLQTDPIGYSGGMNLYAYVENDPLNLTDPSGLVNATVVGEVVITSFSQLKQNDLVANDIDPAISGTVSSPNPTDSTEVGGVTITAKKKQKNQNVTLVDLSSALNGVPIISDAPWVEVAGDDPSKSSKICDYYGPQCKKEGGLYLCVGGPTVCSLWPNDPKGRAVKTCLQQMDRMACTNKQSLQCFAYIHYECWSIFGWTKPRQ